MNANGLKKMTALALACLLSLSLLAGCVASSPSTPAANPESTPASTAAPTASTPAEPAEVAHKMVIISNRSFGDKGPIDSQLRGLEYAASLGWETKQLESLSPDVYEEDIRAMAEQGYNVIVTSFPPVQVAAETVAKDFPDTKFIGIYQFTNAGETPIDNIWSLEYKSQEMMYALGVLHAKMSTSKKIGIISGQETASSNSGINGFMAGVKDTDPTCSVEFAFANTYDDPAVGKEIAMAMISRGVDTIALSAGKTGTGAIEACQEAGIFVTGDNSDYYDLGPNSLVTNLLTDFGEAIVIAVDDIEADAFKGGQHEVMSIYNKGAIVVWELVDRFMADNPENADLIAAAYEAGLEAYEKVQNGDIEVPFNADTPQNVVGQ